MSLETWHLGDGAYFVPDSHGFWLRANSHIVKDEFGGCTDQVFVDPSAEESLLDILLRRRAERGGADVAVDSE